MKKIILVLFLLLSVKGFSQDADSSDFFRIGLYSGNYSSTSNGIKGQNSYFNSIALEVEYIKFKNVAVYFRSIYEFTDLFDYYIGYTYLNSPKSYRSVNSFGVKYIIGERNIKPYLKLGLNQEITFVGDYSYYETSFPQNITRFSEFWYYIYSLNIGIGLNVKIAKNLSADINYDLYRIMGYEHDYFYGRSVLAGFKYNIIY